MTREVTIKLNDEQYSLLIKEVSENVLMATKQMLLESDETTQKMIRLLQEYMLCARTGNMEEKKDTRNPAAVALGRLGGLKGGKARTAKYTPEERSDMARKGAIKRWARSKAEIAK